MKYPIFILLGLWTLGLPAQDASTSNVAEVPGWFLTWHDEFDGNELDLSKWTPDNRNLHKNNELQHYMPDDACVHDGLLTLRSQQREHEGQPYTSGLVDSRGKFYQAYGRFEARVKVPKGKGLWPAFWLLPEDASWPPEIDILEFLGHIPNVVHMTLHAPGPGGVITQHKDFFGPYFPKDFHTFAVEWEPEEMRFLVDGKVRTTYKEHIPDKPHFIILNTAVGGDWPGAPDDPKVFPAAFDVDYVRVWAREIPGTCVLGVCGEHGRVAVDPPNTGRFRAGQKVVMLAHPDIGYKFDHWSGDLSGSAIPLQGNMEHNMVVTAHFIPDADSFSKSRQALSLNKPSESSSDENSLFSSDKAFDGNLETRWSSQHRDPQWLMVDLGKPHQIDSVRLIWQNPAGGYFIHAFAPEYSIQVSDNNKSWKTVYSTQNGDGGTEEINHLNASGRYIRYYGASRHTTHGHTIIEFEVFGK